MKDILFLGDSLTAGNLGCSYFSILKEEPRLGGFNLINLGEDGFTMAGLLAKLEDFLDSRRVPEVLILEGGANDILLPYMQRAGRAWDPFIRKLLRHGSRPADNEEDFKNTVTAALSLAEERGIQRLLLCTIPFLTEDPESELNRLRDRYNAIFNEFSRSGTPGKTEIEVLDLAADVPLSPGGSGWIFKTPVELQEDAILIRKIGEDELCRQRGLRFSIDGAHPNRRGAALIASRMLEGLGDITASSL